MKGEHKDLAELLVICGVFALLLICIVIEAVRGTAVDLNNVINALVIVLTSVGSHLFGKKAAIAAPDRTGSVETLDRIPSEEKEDGTPNA